jgi:hypothetical protein
MLPQPKPWAMREDFVVPPIGQFYYPKAASVKCPGPFVPVLDTIHAPSDILYESSKILNGQVLMRSKSGPRSSEWHAEGANAFIIKPP